MEPMTMMAIGQGVLGAAQGISSAIQRRKALRQWKPLKTPSSAIAATRIAEEGYNQNELPGASLYRQNALRGLAGGIEAAQRTGESSGDVARNVSGYSRGYADFERQMGIAAGQQKLQSRAQYVNAMQNLSQWDLYKYQDRMNKLNVMLGGAEQMGQAASTNIGSALGLGMQQQSAQQSMKFQSDMFDKEKSWMMEMSKLQNPNAGAGSSPVFGFKAKPFSTTNYGAPNYGGFNNPFNS